MAVGAGGGQVARQVRRTPAGRRGDRRGSGSGPASARGCGVWRRISASKSFASAGEPRASTTTTPSGVTTKPALEMKFRLAGTAQRRDALDEPDPGPTTSARMGGPWTWAHASEGSHEGSPKASQSTAHARRHRGRGRARARLRAAAGLAPGSWLALMLLYAHTLMFNPSLRPGWPPASLKAPSAWPSASSRSARAFCLRSAVIEFARNLVGGKLTVWLFAFATAVVATQALALAGWLRCQPGAADRSARQPVGRGGRRCAVRHGHDPGPWAVRAAAGAGRPGQPALGDVGAGVRRHRAGLAWTGMLSPLAGGHRRLPGRSDGGAARDLIARTGIGHGGGARLRRRVAGRRRVLGAAAEGARPGAGRSPWAWAWRSPGWWVTWHIGRLWPSTPHPDAGLSFTGPSADSADARALRRDKPPNFDLGLMPGVFARRLRRRGAVPASSSSRASRAVPACAATSSAPC
jgi:hypothetical protein